MIDHDFANYLESHKTEAQILEDLISTNKIPSCQLQLLPPVDMKPDSSNFDTTLLICLLRHVCGLKPPSYTVWINPSPSDFSVEADLTRLRKCKNQLQHRETVFISEAEFTVKWNELRQILLRLSTVRGMSNLPSLIKEAEKMDIGEELTKHFDRTLNFLSTTEDLVVRGIEELQLSMKENLQELMESLKEVREMIHLSKKTIENMDLTLHECKPKQLDKDESNKTIFRIRSQLIDLGTVVLQKHFHYRVGNDFAKYLAANEAEKTKLHWLIDTNRINELQGTVLLELCQTKPSSNDSKTEKTPLPPSDQTPSSSYMHEDDSDESCSSLKSTNFFISLLTVLLRYVCGLRAPNDKVWKEPSPKDMSLEADISRLGQCKNSIMKLKQLDKENFDKLWKELREILTRLGRGVGYTDDLISSTGDADFDDDLDQLHLNMLDKWNANDQRDIKLEQEYAQKDFFKDSDDDAWTIDEENVSVLLSKGKLPNARPLEIICGKFGSSSPTVRKVCAYISNTLQMTSQHIKRCWPAYIYDDKKNKNDINLVTFVAVKDIEDKLNIDKTFEYNIYELFHGCNSAETSEMMELDIKNANKFNEEMEKIEEYITNHSFSLMNSHSNITLIAGSTVKSINYTTGKTIYEKPCIAIYVHKKGYIPLNENPFQTKLGGFDTDIRECVVSLLFGNDKAYEKHEKLLMGTSIRNHCSIGTLGGFVDHTRYGLCALTCAHVMCGDHLNGIAGVKHWSTSDPTIEVFQPASKDGDKIGKVVCALLSQDDRLTTRTDNRVGIDIALVQIDTRRPDSGQFAIDTSAALNANEYNSGSVLNRKSIQRGAVIIKYGSETGRTEAQVVNRSCCFRVNTCILNNQVLVYNKPQPDQFAAEGDSGSLSFVEDDNGLHAIGVLVGGDLQWQTCCLTPLSDILDALSEDNTVQVTMKNFVVPDEPMQE